MLVPQPVDQAMKVSSSQLFLLTCRRYLGWIAGLQDPHLLPEGEQLLLADALPALHLGQHPEAGAGGDQPVDGGHAQLVAPQDPDLLHMPERLPGQRGRSARWMDWVGQG